MPKLINLIGNTYGLITPLQYKNGKWICACDCGNIVTVNSQSLKNGNTKSCGCLKSITSKNNAHILHNNKRKDFPSITSAKRIWSKKIKNISNISFMEFYNLSLLDCEFCKSKPSCYYNYFEAESSRASEYSIKNGGFNYNKISKIDPLLDFKIDNVITCCNNCYHAKMNFSKDDFLIWCKTLKTKSTQYKKNNHNLPFGSELVSLKCHHYNCKTELSLEEFHNYSKMKCFTCGKLESSFFNRALSDKKSSQKAKDNGYYYYNNVCDLNEELWGDSHIAVFCNQCYNVKKQNNLKNIKLWIKNIKQCIK